MSIGNSVPLEQMLQSMPDLNQGEGSPHFGLGAASPAVMMDAATFRQACGMRVLAALSATYYTGIYQRNMSLDKLVDTAVVLTDKLYAKLTVPDAGTPAAAAAAPYSKAEAAPGAPSLRDRLMMMLAEVEG